MPQDFELSFPPSEEAPRLPEEGELRTLAAKRLRVDPAAIGTARVRRLSFDARWKHRLWRVTVRAWTRDEPQPGAIVTAPPVIERPRPEAPRVAIVGSGPAGMFGALGCLEAGLNVTVFERGPDVRTRRKALQAANRGLPIDRDANYCFGEGGAGTYSDGKLYARSGSKADVRGVLETLVAHGAPQEILVSWRPHVGSNRLPDVVRSLRESILNAGGEVRFGTRVESLETRAEGPRPRVTGLTARELATSTLTHHACDALVLATGHSALDSLLLAASAGARLEPKGFAMGARIEHPQAWVDERQYAGLRGPCELPASFYELVSQQEGRGVYSFCMCPGGFIVPASTAPERVVVNGMSLSRRDSPWANSGVVVQIEPADWCGAAGAAWGWSDLLAQARALGADLGPDLGGQLPGQPGDDPLFGVRLQLALETVAAHLGGGGNRAPAQRADALVAGRGELPPARPTSYRPGVTVADLTGLFPRGMLERLRSGLAFFDGRLRGFASETGQLLGVESRTSSPVRIARDRETLESPELLGFYPAGEGAGYAGGIVSAALDGRRVAQALGRVLA